MTDRMIILQQHIDADARRAMHRPEVSRLAARALKKFRVPSDRVALHDKAILDFVERNRSMKDRVIDLPDDVVSLARTFIEHVLWTGTTKMYGTVQTSIVPEVFSDLYGDGKGSVNDPYHRYTHVADKFRKPGTTTKGCVPWVSYLLDNDPTLFANLKKVTKKYGPIKEVQGNRVSTVYKNGTERRVTAKEATWNMRCQLAVGRHITECLRVIGFMLESQQGKNRALARKGSMNGLIATLDLSKASDSIIVKLIQLLWPADIFSVMMDIRSPSFTASTSNEKFDEELYVMSTMGNGFTFPMMTLTILALIYANRSPKRNNWIDWSITAVNGDDIIVPCTEVETLISLLEGAGFAVNRDKSFATGSFRESCGGDYENGKDITPFYIYSLDTEEEVYITLNKVLRWIATHRYPLNNLVYYLLSLAPYRPVPMWMQETAGVQTCHVPHSYLYWRCHTKKKKVRDNIPFDIRLAIFGVYTEYEDKKGSRHLLYTTRECKITYKESKALLPRGYSDGWDPLWGNQGDAYYISDYVSIMTT